MEELAALAASGAASLVGLMISDSWNHVRETVARFIARERKPEDTMAELDRARHRLIAAQERGDEGAVRDISAEWQSYLYLLLCTDPTTAEELRAMSASLDNMLAGEQSPGVSNVINGGVQHGPVVQTGQITGTAVHTIHMRLAEEQPKASS
ncbi:hypothetical protein VT50_0218690 [Streptomyces antioxidans]|uniref:Uncharacterized protein n=1 Tax=Streptomyces antioxidans TaxID=1507734 RepID=A0A1V4D469_9ACTN|nr:hypothetical protein [Streptomyces antioxidans]OPF78602.1 hypothetical protein VT50_0218690 [Streptomyces antioxidans]